MVRLAKAKLNKRSQELELAWIENEINPASRTLRFFANLPNRIDADDRNTTGQRYVQWEFRPGQRMQLSIPVETWEEQFVLPVDAVVKEGFESFLFLQNGDQFDRVAVHEKFRDTTSVVVENDGAVYPGDIVALRGAHQMHMALKNKSGGGADPHAGHNH
ncbi:MAG: efflux RND transporter periplasmic adaptor subunit [Pirellulales bacterium]